MNLLKKYFKIKNNSKLKLKRVDTGLELVNDLDRRAYCIITVHILFLKLFYLKLMLTICKKYPTSAKLIWGYKSL